jgi:DNA-binding MarR family transcriptional regulator
VPVTPAENTESMDQLGPAYRDVLNAIERFHCRRLDIIKDELKQRGRVDINPVQAVLIYDIAEQELTASELRKRGCSLQSNMSYNVKKLIDMGLIEHQRSAADQRSVRIKLTEAGRDVFEIVEALYAKHLRNIEKNAATDAVEFEVINKTLRRLERFWTDQVLYRL